jgi:benzodiazapine receptor
MTALKLMGCLFLCELAATVGLLFSCASVFSSWYANLLKPPFTPPSWLFIPVWVIMFGLTGLSLYFLHESQGWLGDPDTWFIEQTGMSIVWSFVFFQGHDLLWGFATSTWLWFSVLATTLSFWHHSKRAGATLLPYLLFVTTIAFLNYEFWIFNV